MKDRMWAGTPRVSFLDLDTLETLVAKIPEGCRTAFYKIRDLHSLKAREKVPKVHQK